jgi:hypothetical protein
MLSKDLADVAAVGGSLRQQFPACHSAGPLNMCTPVGSGSLEVGDKVFPWQRVFSFSSLTCLAWEADSCSPAPPFSLLARHVYPACDLPPRALVFSCTHALHCTACTRPRLAALGSPLVVPQV